MGVTEAVDVYSIQNTTYLQYVTHRVNRGETAASVMQNNSVMWAAYATLRCLSQFTTRM